MNDSENTAQLMLPQKTLLRGTVWRVPFPCTFRQSSNCLHCRVHVIKRLLKPNTSAFTSPHASVHPMQLTSPGCHPGLSVAAGRWQPPPRPGRPRPWHWHRHSTVARRFERRRWQHPHPPGQVGWIQWRLWTLVVQCGITARLKWRIQFFKQIKFQIFIYTSSARTSRGRKFPKGKELYSTERICL